MIKIMWLLSHLIKTRSEAIGMRLRGNLFNSISSEKMKRSLLKKILYYKHCRLETMHLIVFNVSYQELYCHVSSQFVIKRRPPSVTFSGSLLRNISQPNWIKGQNIQGLRWMKCDGLILPQFGPGETSKVSDLCPKKDATEWWKVEGGRVWDWGWIGALAKVGTWPRLRQTQTTLGHGGYSTHWSCCWKFASDYFQPQTTFSHRSCWAELMPQILA